MIDIRWMDTYQTPYDITKEFTLILSTRVKESELKDFWKNLKGYEHQESIPNLAQELKNAINYSINQEIEKRNPKLPVSIDEIETLLNELIDSYNLLLAGIKPEKSVETLKTDIKDKIKSLKKFEGVKIEKADLDIEKLFESFFKKEE